MCNNVSLLLICFQNSITLIEVSVCVCVNEQVDCFTNATGKYFAGEINICKLSKRTVEGAILL